jgi:Flp pilus assembly protein TadB
MTRNTRRRSSRNTRGSRNTRCRNTRRSSVARRNRKVLRGVAWGVAVVTFYVALHTSSVGIVLAVALAAYLICTD